MFFLRIWGWGLIYVILIKKKRCTKLTKEGLNRGNIPKNFPKTPCWKRNDEDICNGNSDKKSLIILASLLLTASKKLLMQTTYFLKYTFETLEMKLSINKWKEQCYTEILSRKIKKESRKNSLVKKSLCQVYLPGILSIFQNHSFFWNTDFWKQKLTINSHNKLFDPQKPNIICTKKQKLTLKILMKIIQKQCKYSGNNENKFLYSNKHLQLWTYFTPCSSVSIVNFEHVNADRGIELVLN